MRYSILIFILAGCPQASLGVDSYLETQRAATEELCSCASSLGTTVRSCFEDYDVIASDAVGSECVRNAAEAADATDSFACSTRAAATLESCAARSRCDEMTLELCLDAWQTDLSRCPPISSEFNRALFVCGVHAASDETIVDQFLAHDALHYEWVECAEPILRPNPSFVRATLECMLIALDESERCEGADCGARLDADLALCPGYHAEIAAALEQCSE